jgi:hypothetical protein
MTEKDYLDPKGYRGDPAGNVRRMSGNSIGAFWSCLFSNFWVAAEGKASASKDPTDLPRQTVLGRHPPNLLRLEAVSHRRGSRHGRAMAPIRVCALLALNFPGSLDGLAENEFQKRSEI